MADPWAPAPSSHGAQAALLAHRAAGKAAVSSAPSTGHGHMAANSAFRADRNSMRSTRADGLGRQRSLMAAQGAMGTSTRRRSNTLPSTKESYPDEANAAANALKAATAAHKPSGPSTSKDAGAVPYVQMNRQMFTSKPPVQPEVAEKSREDELKGQALAMAKKMFSQQQKVIDQTKISQAGDAPSARGRRRSSSSLSDGPVQPMQFSSLQDAAYKAAQERLAKLEAEMKERNYQDYYGNGNGRPQRKLSIRGKLRRRSSSDGDVNHEDRERSQQIRRQMSIFSDKLSAVDEQKRQQDRDALLAVAHKNVQARLKGIDDKIAEETGMMPAATKSNWESKAQAHAILQSESHLSNHGKIDLGAGQFMEQGDIDAIAARRVQPVLDEINERAEKEQARLTELKLEQERQREEKELERRREKEIEDIKKKLKGGLSSSSSRCITTFCTDKQADQEKQEVKERKIEEKAEAKAKKSVDKAAKAEQRRLVKEEKRKSAPVPSTQGHSEEPMDGGRVELNNVGQPVRVRTEGAEIQGTDMPAAIPIQEKAPRGKRSDSSSSGGRSPTNRVKTWLKTRLHRATKSEPSKPKDQGVPKKNFVGGAALTGAADSRSHSTTSVDNGSASVREVALAGRQHNELSDGHSSAGQSPDADGVSPMSSSSDDEVFQDVARNPLTAHSLRAPPKLDEIAHKKSHSPMRDSKFHEII